jgi:anti-anti-sigma factor
MRVYLGALQRMLEDRVTMGSKDGSFDGEVFAVEEQATAVIVRVRDELDYLNSERLDTTIARLANGARNIVIDFTECRYIDSSVLSVVVRARKSHGDALRLVIPPKSHIHRIFSIAGLEHTLRIQDTLAQALT